MCFAGISLGSCPASPRTPAIGNCRQSSRQQIIRPSGVWYRNIRGFGTIHLCMISWIIDRSHTRIFTWAWTPTGVICAPCGSSSFLPVCAKTFVCTVVAALPAYACMLTFPKEVSQGGCISWLPSRLQVRRPLSYQCMLTDCTSNGPNRMVRGRTRLEVVRRRMHVITVFLDFF